MGGTMLALWLIILMVQLMKRLFPYQETEEQGVKEVN
jgi:hypothetical protein